jgi:hypothetical protein
MHPATAVLHGRLAAAAAGAGMGGTAGSDQEIAGLRAVPQTASAVRRQAGALGRQNGAKEPMPSGGGSCSESDHWGLGVGISVVNVREMFYILSSRLSIVP